MWRRTSRSSVHRLLPGAPSFSWTKHLVVEEGLEGVGAVEGVEVDAEVGVVVVVGETGEDTGIVTPGLLHLEMPHPMPRLRLEIRGREELNPMVVSMREQGVSTHLPRWRGARARRRRPRRINLGM
jgi:hypothetical protein